LLRLALVERLRGAVLWHIAASVKDMSLPQSRLDVGGNLTSDKKAMNVMASKEHAPLLKAPLDP
jgi:hypothetical protein